jgi:uncharacterized protein involved in tolerance to divalent cations
MSQEEQEIFMNTINRMVEKNDYELPRLIIMEYYNMAGEYLSFLHG